MSRNSYNPSLHGIMPPRITSSSFGMFSVLPVPVVNKILSPVLRTTSPVRIKAPRRQHGQYVSIVPPQESEYRTLVLVSRKIKKGAMWNYLAANVENGTEVLLVWGGEKIPPVLRVTDLNKYLHFVKGPLTINMGVKVFERSTHYWLGDDIVPETIFESAYNLNLQLQAKLDGDKGMMRVALVREEEDGSYGIRTRPEFKKMAEVLGECQGERFDVYFLWRAVREVEKAVERWGRGELL